MRRSAVLAASSGFATSSRVSISVSARFFPCASSCVSLKTSSREFVRPLSSSSLQRGDYGAESGRGSGLGVLSIAAAAAAAAAAFGAAQTPEASLSEAEQDSAETCVGVTQYPANRPIEDRLMVHRAFLPKGEHYLWWFAVFDGHGGWQCADYAHKRLHHNLLTEYSNRDAPYDSNEHVDPHVMLSSLRAAFERTDRQYMSKVADAFEVGFGRDTRAGSCALAAVVVDKMLYVANCGDSRAVMGINRRAKESREREMRKLRQSPAPERGAFQSRSNAPDIEDPDDLDPGHSTRMAANALQMDASLREAAIAVATGKIDEIDKATEAAVRSSLLKSMHSTRAKSHTELQMAGAELPSASEDDGASGTDSDVDLDDGDTVFIAEAMSYDHNCREKIERERLEHEHPGEADVVVCRPNSNACYIKGKLQPSRALGDFYLKYSEFVPLEGSHASAGRRPKRPFSPPYIRATPEVEVRPLTKGIHEFLILATDGLWDYLDNQEAVNIAGKCFEDGQAHPCSRASQILEEAALKKAAEKKGMTLDQIKMLPQGRSRRSKHDDISVVVISLRELC